MQIIRGKFKGRKLIAVPTDATRPTLARIKGSMFDMLDEYIAGSNVLDLFAGSGALGIECVSRGAKHVVFVDNQKESIKTIKTNLKQQLDGVTLVESDYERALFSFAKSGQKFDLVLLDPPFDSDYLEKVLYLLHKKELLDNGAIIMCEMNNKKLLQNYPQKYIIDKVKEYGFVKVVIFKYQKESA